jgi:hypothetical protein
MSAGKPYWGVSKAKRKYHTIGVAAGPPTMREGTEMTRLTIGALLAGTLAFAVAGLANATPLGSASAGLKVNDLSVIEYVHHCNHVCVRGAVEEWGGEVRWHRHVGRACRPVHCRG